jgi:glycosyltransferase involved in cell wall biosynthesis
LNAEPKVSIIIPFYNCPYVDQAIQSARSQSYSNIEIIVVDDGSTAHRQLIIPYLDSIRYYYKSNGGTASALNYGISQATGQYFAWLSSDDIYMPDKIERQLQFMLAHHALISHTAYYYINAESVRTSEPIRCSFLSPRHLLETLIKECPINGCSIMMEMSVLRKVGLFNEERRYTHDYDLWLRILPYFRLFYLDVPLLEYRLHNNMGTVLYRDELYNEMRLVQDTHREAILQLIQQEG